MTAVTIRSDCGAQEKEICHYFHLFPFYLPCGNGARSHDLRFLIFSLKPALLPPSFTLIKRLFNSSLLSAIRVISSAYLRLLIFLPPSTVVIFILNISLTFSFLQSLFKPHLGKRIAHIYGTRIIAPHTCINPGISGTAHSGKERREHISYKNIQDMLWVLFSD